MALQYMVLLICGIFSQNADTSSDTPLAQQMNLLQKIMNSFQAELAMVTDKLNRAETELSSTKDELLGVKAELRLAEADIAGLNINLKQGSDPVKYAEIKSELDSMKAAGNITHDELENMRTELRSAKDEITVLKTQLNSCPNQTELSDVLSEIASLKSSGNNWHMVSDEIIGMKSELRSAERNIRELQGHQTITSSSHEVANITEEMTALKSEWLSLSSQLNVSLTDSLHTSDKISQDEIGVLRSQMSETSEKLNQSLLEVNKNTKEIDNLNSQVLAAKITISSSLSNLSSLMDELPVLERNMSALWNRIGEDLKSQNLLQSTNRDIATIKSDVNTTVMEFSRLKQDISYVNTKLNNFEQEALGMGIHNASCCDQLPALTDLVNEMRLDVAFEVTESTKSSGWTTLNFDNVQLNTGDGYNATSGMFTAPRSGTYLFWADLDISYGGIDYNEVYIMKGTEIMARGYTEISPSIDHNVISVMAVVYLRTGEQVYFELMAEYFAVEGGKRSSYGGTLIRVH